MPSFETGKSVEITVRYNPGVSSFNRYSRQIRILDQSSCSADLLAEMNENIPVPRFKVYRYKVGLVPQSGNEINRGAKLAGRL